jgi:predicted SAM-dependent methyltransferase
VIALFLEGDGMNLKEQLIKEAKTRWLDVGCGRSYEDGFYYMDMHHELRLPRDIRSRYFRGNILTLSNAEVRKLGQFDLVRMQHVFEHMTPEDGLICLDNCAKLVKKGGYLVLTTPDLRIHVNKYLDGSIKGEGVFHTWANQRVQLDAPESFYFSIFSHSMRHEEHKWCYDKEGLLYQVNRSNKFKEVKVLELSDVLSVVPFTHNRPEEDVCVIARR